MATGDQPTSKGAVAAVVAAIAAVLVAIVGNFQNIFGEKAPKPPNPGPNAATSQPTGRPEIKAEDGSVVINNSTTGRDITVGKDSKK